MKNASRFIGLTLLFGFEIGASALPENFRCVPEEFYSGGFDIYEVKVSTGEGKRFFQATTPHGLKLGKPVLRETVALTLKSDSFGHTSIEGFESSLSIKDSLVLPNDWEGKRLRVKSKLFDNDMFSDGLCQSI